MKDNTLLVAAKTSLKPRSARKPRALSDSQLQETVGNSLACAWRVAPGVIWVQIREPDLAARLREVNGCKLISQNADSRFFRIYEFNRSLAWADGWCRRALASLGERKEER